MKQIHPYKINVYNKITQRMFAQYYANQPPVKGDQIHVYPDRNPEDPFGLNGAWIVDQVVWIVSGHGSVNALEIAKETGGDYAGAFCDWIEVHVWPTQGPHWAETPRFAKVLTKYDDDDEEEEGNDLPVPVQEAGHALQRGSLRRQQPGGAGLLRHHGLPGGRDVRVPGQCNA